MTLEKAIKIFNKNYDKKVVAYSKKDGFFILITEDRGLIDCNYYIVVSEKIIIPTNPIIIDLNENEVYKV